jgi:hypothetical protein
LLLIIFGNKPPALAAVAPTPGKLVQLEMVPATVIDDRRRRETTQRQNHTRSPRGRFDLGNRVVGYRVVVSNVTVSIGIGSTAHR